MLNLFQIPAEDFEGPLHLALDHPSVKRYLLFNSNFFNFFLAPVSSKSLVHTHPTTEQSQQDNM